MGSNQQSKGGGYARNKGTQPYASKGGNKMSKTVDAATALGLGILPQQNTMLSGLAGLGMAQQNPLDSLFGSVGTNVNPLAGITGLNTSLQSANDGNVLFQLAALLGGQHQSVSSSACSAPAGTTVTSACTAATRL